MLTFHRLTIATALALGAFLLAGLPEAKAVPLSLEMLASAAASPVETVGYYRRYRRGYIPESYTYQPKYRSYSYRHYGNGQDEIRELQRLFPETNWPPSMRYHQY